MGGTETGTLGQDLRRARLVRDRREDVRRVPAPNDEARTALAERPIQGREGILQEVKRRRFYEKPSVKRKRKMREARKRRRREAKRRGGK